jgi:hypothetical protein
MKPAVGWFIFAILLFSLTGMFFYAQSQTFVQRHKEFELSGEQLYKTYCISCHAEKEVINKIVMTKNKKYMTLDAFGRITQFRHNEDLNKVLYISDIEPLYRYLSSIPNKE